MIDTHAHIQKVEYEDNDKIIKSAHENGVEKIICVAYDIKSSIEAVELANKYDYVYAIVGVQNAASTVWIWIAAIGFVPIVGAIVVVVVVKKKRA